jgi:cytochrome d ubiquinol oxidase subunit I
MAALPLSYLALEAGWITREVGRQPWIIYGVIRTEEGATALPPATVAASLLGFAGFYLALLIFFLLFARKLLRRGPMPQDAPGGLSMAAVTAGPANSGAADPARQAKGG